MIILAGGSLGKICLLKMDPYLHFYYQNMKAQKLKTCVGAAIAHWIKAHKEIQQEELLTGQLSGKD